MITIISNFDFHEAFRTYDRTENFSTEGLDALFEYYTDYEAATGEQIELDVISICCDWSEEYLDDIRINYSLEGSTDGEVLDFIRDATTVIELDGGNRVLYVQF